MKRLVVLLATVLVGCATILDTGMGRRVALVEQRNGHDCAIAALAMATDTSYDRVDVARKQLGIDDSNGLTASQVVRIAALMHLRLDYATGEPNPAQDEGIVVVQVNPGDLNYAHAVYLYHAYVYDPADTSSPTPYVLAYTHWFRVYYTLRILGHI